MYRKFEEIETRHRRETKELHIEFTTNYTKQRDSFERTMNQIVKTFNEQIHESNNWHEKHSTQLVEIKSSLKNIL
jgi:hypothetical protein